MDLAETLNKLIYEYKLKGETSDVNRKLIAHLYDLKTVRNKLAHPVDDETPDEKMQILLKVLEFITFIQSYKISKYDGHQIENTKNDLRSELNETIDKYRIDFIPKQIISYGRDYISDYKSIVRDYAELKAKLVNISQAYESLVGTLEDRQLIDSSMGPKDGDFEYFGDKEIDDINNYVLSLISGEKINEEHEWAAYFAEKSWDIDVCRQLENNISRIKNALKNRISYSGLSGQIEEVKNKIEENIKINIVEDKLKELRETIIIKEKIDRKCCILRKSIIKHIVQYRIKSEDEFVQFFDQEDECFKKQQKYIKLIIGIISKT